MKRRNADSGKMRRPLKRNKITEGIYGSTLLYLKFLLLWAMVLFADYLSEFRFEFLWPLWMMLRSVYDSFKYQGLAFSVFFVFIALTSDVICYFFIPVQWIFFVASTYVWVQYVWYTDKGICLPTVALCAALVWAEATLRGSGARDPRSSPSPLFPSHVDLCRPFAAHCVGYPVVTLGFGVKTYVGHRIRLRRQRDVKSENEFYYQLLKQALPEAATDQPAIKDSPEKPLEKVEIESKPHLNGSVVNHSHTKSKKCDERVHKVFAADPVTTETPTGVRHTIYIMANHIPNHSHTNGLANHTAPSAKEKPLSGGEKNHAHSSTNGVIPNHASHSNHVNQVDKLKANEVVEEKVEKSEKEPSHSTKAEVKVQNDLQSPPVIEAVPVEKTKGTMKTSSKWERKENAANIQREERRKAKNRDKEGPKERDKDTPREKDHNDNHRQAAATDTPKETPVQKEREIISIKEERRQEKEREREREREAKEKKEREKEKEKSQSRELEEREKWWTGEVKRYRTELTEAKAAEAEARAELRRALAASSQQERQRVRDLQQLRRTNEDLHTKINSITTWRSSERAERASLERRLAEERRARTAVEQRLSAPPVPPTGPCLRAECREEMEALRRDIATARSPPPPPPLPPIKDPNSEELQRLAERATHLERSLSAETRIKLDLFSALGEVKRQLEIKGGLLYARDKEIDQLKSKIAQMLAVMPPDSFVSPLSYGHDTTA